jgi:hypothetical protein
MLVFGRVGSSFALYANKGDDFLFMFHYEVHRGSEDLPPFYFLHQQLRTDLCAQARAHSGAESSVALKTLNSKTTSCKGWRSSLPDDGATVVLQIRWFRQCSAFAKVVFLFRPGVVLLVDWTRFGIIRFTIFSSLHLPKIYSRVRGVNSENQYGAIPCRSVRASRRCLRSADRSTGSAGVSRCALEHTVVRGTRIITYAVVSILIRVNPSYLLKRYFCKLMYGLSPTYILR